MTTTRRTALSMLGLGTATAVGVETFIAAPALAGKIQAVGTTFNKERYAKAFEQLASELRRGSVNILNLKLSASIEPDAIGDVHELSVRFHYSPEV